MEFTRRDLGKIALAKRQRVSCQPRSEASRRSGAYQAGEGGELSQADLFGPRLHRDSCVAKGRDDRVFTASTAGCALCPGRSNFGSTTFSLIFDRSPFSSGR